MHPRAINISFPFSKLSLSVVKHPGISANVPHAPVRTPHLTDDEFKLALRNALRYFPKEVLQSLGFLTRFSWVARNSHSIFLHASSRSTRS